MADQKPVSKEEASKPIDETSPRSRNKGKGITDYDEKHPNPADIHSDDPMVAGLANGVRQVQGEDPDNAAPVK